MPLGTVPAQIDDPLAIAAKRTGARTLTREQIAGFVSLASRHLKSSGHVPWSFALHLQLYISSRITANRSDMTATASWRRSAVCRRSEGAAALRQQLERAEAAHGEGANNIGLTHANSAWMHRRAFSRFFSRALVVLTPVRYSSA